MADDVRWVVGIRGERSFTRLRDVGTFANQLEVRVWVAANRAKLRLKPGQTLVWAKEDLVQKMLGYPFKGRGK